MSDRTATLILRTVNEVFPYVSLWRSPQYRDVIAVVSSEPLEPDFAAMEARFNRREIRNDIARMGVPNLASLLIHHVMGPERLLRDLPAGDLNRIGNQRLEYLAPRDYFRNAHSSFLKDADPLRGEVASTSNILLDQYAVWRKQQGDPIHPDELEYVAARSRAGMGDLIRARASQGALPREPSMSSARGGLARPEEMDLYEASFWAHRYRTEGSLERAAPYARRAALLTRARPTD